MLIEIFIVTFGFQKRHNRACDCKANTQFESQPGKLKCVIPINES